MLWTVGLIFASCSISDKAVRDPNKQSEMDRLLNSPMGSSSISFGDTVRVRSTNLTEGINLAGLVGTVYGETTPSVTGVEVVGKQDSDYAINVHFENKDLSIWFAPKLLEFVDHGAGATIRIDGVDKQWIRDETGKWIEYPVKKNGVN